MPAIAASLVERIRSDNQSISLDILEARLTQCNDCEHCQYNHCQRIGCSVWRFRETILSQTPACPLGKHI